MSKVTVEQVDGGEYGYPESCGVATVTFINGEPASIVFANGLIEARVYHDGMIHRTFVGPGDETSSVSDHN